MLEPIIYANSNGTLVQDISAPDANYADLEQLRPGIHDDLKRDKAAYFEEYISLCDILSDDGKYKARPVNGFEGFARDSRTRVAIFAGASSKYLKDSYKRNGLEDAIDSYISVFDDEVRGDKPFTKKDETAYQKIKEIEISKGRIPVAYISHKAAEAELGADVYGVGILIDPNAAESYRYRTKSGKGVVVVKSLDDPYVKTVVEYLSRPVKVDDQEQEGGSGEEQVDEEGSEVSEDE